MTTLHGKEINIGDEVWDSIFGWATVVEICEASIYQIETTINIYTREGLLENYNKYPQLFWQEFEIPAHAFEKPKSKVKKYQVLFEGNGNYFTTGTWREKNYLTNRKEFDKANNKGFKFISLIIESEIEVDE